MIGLLNGLNACFITGTTNDHIDNLTHLPVDWSVTDGNVHGANVGSTWGLQDPGGLHAGHMNFAICGCLLRLTSKETSKLHITGPF